MNNAMIDLTSDLLRDHIEELMKGDWEAVRDEVALCLWSSIRITWTED